MLEHVTMENIKNNSKEICKSGVLMFKNLFVILWIVSSVGIPVLGTIYLFTNGNLFSGGMFFLLSSLILSVINSTVFNWFGKNVTRS